MTDASSIMKLIHDTEGETTYLLFIDCVMIYAKEIAKASKEDWLAFIGLSDNISDQEEKMRRMVEINVEEQVFDLVKTSIVQKAWRKEQTLFVHGLVYDVANGILKDLNVSVHNNAHLDTVYKFSTQIS
jgi:carbonic anhydrase